MVSSPIGKGILFIGGEEIDPLQEEKTPCVPRPEFWKTKARRAWLERQADSTAILELSGDSIESLHWTILYQRLQFPRSRPMAFPISEEICHNLKQNIMSLVDVD